MRNSGIEFESLEKLSNRLVATTWTAGTAGGKLCIVCSNFSLCSDDDSEHTFLCSQPVQKKEKPDVFTLAKMTPTAVKELLHLKIDKATALLKKFRRKAAASAPAPAPAPASALAPAPATAAAPAPDRQPATSKSAMCCKEHRRALSLALEGLVSIA
jgi:hypothetical protein